MCPSPAVSVITTVFNGERHLEACVRSVTAQSGVDVETVIVSDGSTDGTDDLLATLADEHVVTAVRPRLGRGRALNEAVALSRGPYLAILDADDLALPDRLRASAAYLDEHPETVLVGSGQWVFVDEYGTELGRRQSAARTDAEIRRLLRRGVVPFAHSSVMMRRTALDAVGGYDEDLVHAVDLDLYIRLTGRGSLAVLPQALVASRRHGEQYFTGRRGDSRPIRRRAATRLTIDRRAAAAFGGSASTTRAVGREVGAWAYWSVRRLLRAKPVLPVGLRSRLDRCRVRAMRSTRP